MNIEDLSPELLAMFAKLNKLAGEQNLRTCSMLIAFELMFGPNLYYTNKDLHPWEIRFEIQDSYGK